MVLSLVAFYVILDFVGQDVKWLGLKTQLGLIMIYLGGISNYIWMTKGTSKPFQQARRSRPGLTALLSSRALFVFSFR